MEEIKFEIQKGHQIDVENSDLSKGIIKLKKLAETYEDIRKSLFCDNEVDFKQYASLDEYYQPHFQERNSTVCRIMLLNIAHYFNSKTEENNNYFIYYSVKDDFIDLEYIEKLEKTSFINGQIFFKKHEDARKAIEILGEKVVKDALKPNI